MGLQKYLFRVFYIGNYFNGFQRQPNGNTVENYIEMAFIRSHLISSFNEQCSYEKSKIFRKFVAVSPRKDETIESNRIWTRGKLRIELST